jgi:hypothetical protein
LEYDDSAALSGDYPEMLFAMASELQATDRVPAAEKRFSEEGRMPQSAAKVQPMPPPRPSMNDNGEDVYEHLANPEVELEAWRALGLSQIRPSASYFSASGEAPNILSSSECRVSIHVPFMSHTSSRQQEKLG